ncbi:MAG: DUF2666 family protein [Candidatus Anstonellales archaeon]
MESKESISLMARCRGWEVIKKASIDSATTPQEIAFTLSGMQESLDRKAYDFLGINTNLIDQYSQSLAKGKKKSLKGLGEVLSTLEPSEISFQLKAACPEEKLLDVAKTYFIRSLVKAFGFDTLPNRELLSKIYPELKIPKPRGNFSGKKAPKNIQNTSKADF